MDVDEFGIVIDTEGTAENAAHQQTKTGDNSIIRQALQEYYEEKLAEQQQVKDAEVEKPKSKYMKFSDEMGWRGPRPRSPTGRKQQLPRQVIDPRKDLIEDRVGVKSLLGTSSVLHSEFEKQETLPAYDVSEKKLREQRKKEREKTKGKNWFNMPATEVTEEVKRDLEVLQMRSVLDPKHFYKKNDLKVLPKYFQIGTVQDSALEFHDRLTNKQRKRTLVDELMADAEFNRYNKKKYAEIVAEKQKTHYGAYRAAKKLKRKKNK